MAASNTESSQLPEFVHTPFYCEENVYLLCKKLCSSGIADADGSDLFVVFISNEKKQIPLWHQKASHRADGIALWDYHVICVQKKRGGDNPNSLHLVWDLDCSLSFPCPVSTYVAESVRPSFQLFSEYQRYFRVVHAPSFLQLFASDRRHMKDSAGYWMEDPPPYDPIVAQDGTIHNLNEYMEMKGEDAAKNLEADLLDMVYSHKLGLLVGENQLEELFSLLP